MFYCTPAATRNKQKQVQHGCIISVRSTAKLGLSGSSCQKIEEKKKLQNAGNNNNNSTHSDDLAVLALPFVF